jgi:hypothetical protein
MIWDRETKGPAVVAERMLLIDFDGEGEARRVLAFYLAKGALVEPNRDREAAAY